MEKYSELIHTESQLYFFISTMFLVCPFINQTPKKWSDNISLRKFGALEGYITLFLFVYFSLNVQRHKCMFMGTRVTRFKIQPFFYQSTGGGNVPKNTNMSLEKEGSKDDNKNYRISREKSSCSFFKMYICIHWLALKNIYIVFCETKPNPTGLFHQCLKSAIKRMK